MQSAPDNPRPQSHDQEQRLLIVEDDPVLGRLTARCFQRAGYYVRLVFGAEEAEQEASCCDCGIFDIDLVDGDGVTLAERMLRAGMIRCAIFYSGTMLPAEVRRAEAVGSFVLKPARFETLAASVAAALSRRESA